MPFGTHMFHALHHRNDIHSDNDNDGDGGGDDDDDDANTKQLKNCYPCTMRNNDLLVCDLPDVSFLNGYSHSAGYTQGKYMVVLNIWLETKFN